MDNLGLRHNRPFKISFYSWWGYWVKYHPHGDTAVYDALVRMAQNGTCAMNSSTNRETLVTRMETGLQPCVIQKPGWKNFQNSCWKTWKRYSGYTSSTLMTRWMNPLYYLQESPVTGEWFSGIAVGMATNMMPHNLTRSDWWLYCIHR